MKGKKEGERRKGEEGGREAQKKSYLLHLLGKLFSPHLLGEGGSCSALIGLVGLLSSEGLVQDVASDELVDEHAERKYIHLLCVYLCVCVCVYVYVCVCTCVCVHVCV